MTAPGGGGGSGSGDPRALRRAALRKTTLQLVLGVVALDAVALGIYYGAGIGHASAKTQNVFAVTWTLATAITVAILLRRVRQTRFGQPRR